MPVRPYAHKQIVTDDEFGNNGEYGTYDIEERMKEFLGHVTGYKMDIEFYDDDATIAFKKALLAHWLLNPDTDDLVLDYDKITIQQHAVFLEFADGKWRTRFENEFPGCDAGISMVVRSFRTEPMGSYPVQKRLIAPGDPRTSGGPTYEYRIGTYGEWEGREKTDKAQSNWERWICKATIEDFHMVRDLFPVAPGWSRWIKSTDDEEFLYSQAQFRKKWNVA
jgi:hypothetical protein